MSNSQIAAPGIILDKRKIDAHGMSMSGYLEAMTDFLGLLQELYAATKDGTERKVITSIIEPLEERVEEVSRDLNLHAANIGAIRIAQGFTGVQ